MTFDIVQHWISFDFEFEVKGVSKIIEFIAVYVKNRAAAA